MSLKTVMSFICVVLGFTLIIKLIDFVLYFFGINIVSNYYVSFFMLLILLTFPTLVKKLALRIYNTHVKFGLYSYVVPLILFSDDAIELYQTYF
jgi:hypothetical protein